MPVDNRTICDVIRHWADVRPGAPALLALDAAPVTYGELVRLMDGTRRRINAEGLGPADRIALVHRGGADMAALTIAIVSGAAVVPLRLDHTPGEFAAHMVERGVKALMLEDGVSDAASRAARRIGIPVLEASLAGHSSAVASNATPKGAAARTDGARPTGADIAFVLPTSGTTSVAKNIVYRHRAALEQGLLENRFFERNPDDVCLCPQPLFYKNGINQLFSSLSCGGSVLFIPTFSVEIFFRCLSEFGVTCVTASVPFLHRIHENLDSYRHRGCRHRLRFVRVTSGFLEPRIADSLEDFLGVPVVENYSTSETGRIACNPMPPARRKRGTVGPPMDCEIRIRSLDGRFLPTGEEGEIVVRGPLVFEGYENDPRANADAFVDGWFRTGDEGFLDEDGYLTLTGRIKDTINRGGEKVSPAEVDAALMAHPDVREAAVFPIRHPSLGEDVAAAIVQAPGAALTDQSLRDHLLKRLSGFKIPRRFYFVDSIPKGNGGKVQRYRLAEALAVGTAAAPLAPASPVREATPLEARLQGLWAKALGLPRVGLDDNFFLLGGDSLQAVELFLEIERELGHRLPRAALFEAGTVAEMVRLVEADAPPRCLVSIQPQGSRPPFFCIHDGNGHVLNFRDLANHLGRDQPFYGIQCLGLDGKEMPFTELEPMAAHYVAEIKKVQPAGPYFIGGYSFGGRVAYVMAQRMRAVGDEITLLALLDSTSLVGRRRLGARERLRRHRDRLRETPASALPAYAAMRFANLALEARRASVTHLYAWALDRYRKRQRPVPAWLNRPVEANDLIRRATRLTPYDGGAVLFQTAESASSYRDGVNGWSDLVGGGLEVIPIPGQHYQIVKEPHVGVLARLLAACIEERADRPRKCDGVSARLKDAPLPVAPSRPRAAAPIRR